MKKECGAVLSETNYYSGIWKDYNGGIYYSFNKKIIDKDEGIHFHITSDEKIKAGDWCYWSGNDPAVVQIKEFKDSLISECWTSNLETHNSLHPKYLVKIIASTDPKIIIRQCSRCKSTAPANEYMSCKNDTFIGKCGNTTLTNIGVAEIHQSFIKEYCDAGGVDKVMVEFDKIDGHLIINKDNTINISLVKESWSREEVEDLCRRAIDQGECNEGCTANYLHPEDWIEQNL